MNDKYAKEIAKELKLIRKELQKANNKADKKHDEKQTTLKDYVCMNCDWKKGNTKEILDGINCPQCKGNTVKTY